MSDAEKIENPQTEENALHLSDSGQKEDNPETEENPSTNQPPQEGVVEAETGPKDSSENETVAPEDRDNPAEEINKPEEVETKKEEVAVDKEVTDKIEEDKTEDRDVEKITEETKDEEKPAEEVSEIQELPGQDIIKKEDSQDKNDTDGDEVQVSEQQEEKQAEEKEENIPSQEEEVNRSPQMDEGGDNEPVESKETIEAAEQPITKSEGLLEPSAGPPTEESPSKLEEQPTAPPPPPPIVKSAVETASAKDILVTYREAEQTQPLSLNWTFGFNRHIGCLNLSDTSRNLVMYASSHVAVLLDFENHVQKLLLGHANAITCFDCSSDKRWLVTADKGENSSVIVWDSYTGIPVQSIFTVLGDQGTVAVAMSSDAKYIITVSAEKIQTVSVWDWTSVSNEPICSVKLQSAFGVQSRVQFCADDNEQFVTNSDSQVVFFSWASGKLEYHAPYLSDDVFNRAVGLYSQTIYQVDSRQALTGTSQGNIVVWDPERPNVKYGQDKISPIHKRALKLVRLQDRAITTVTQTNGYIVTGDVTGAIKFYDSTLNLINWYNKGMQIGPVTSISFKYNPEFNVEILAETKTFPEDATIPANPFIVRDFTVSTKHAEIFIVNTEGSEFHHILREHDAAVHAIATSSTKPWICIGSYAGLLKIWNYDTKQCMVSRVFEKGNNIQCLAFDMLGLQVAVGMTNGTVHILDTISLTNVVGKPFRYARDAVTHIAFSHDSKYLATADADLATTVFEYETDYGWKYLGRYRAHYKPIQDLSFGVALDSNSPRLLTLGEDRTLVEYDLPNSSKDDLRLLSVDRIEQSAVPSCLAWYPDVTKESFLVTANDQYKFKLYNTTTKMCRKTLLAPTYGSSIRKILPLPVDKREPNNKTRLLAYISKYKVGLQILPLDGNPHKSVALVGHPNGISHLACSHDGRYLFTAGGKDSCVHMWSASVKALEAAAALGGDGLVPFYGLLEGGVDGELFAELENYFYFAQLRSQSIDTTESREVSTVIPLDQIPFVMRALGFYPSEQEIEDMLNEVKFSEYVETGQYVSVINLGDFIKLYVNHRPAFGLSPDEIQKAFNTLGIVSVPGESNIAKLDLYNILQRKGEHMTEQELSDHLATLLGINAEGGSTDFTQTYDDETTSDFLDSILPGQITASMFSEEILGLPVYDAQQ
ncbi:cilia- and flagella-associated protein 251-like [Styela clava]